MFTGKRRSWSTTTQPQAPSTSANPAFDSSYSFLCNLLPFAMPRVGYALTAHPTLTLNNKLRDGRLAKRGKRGQRRVSLGGRPQALVSLQADTAAATKFRTEIRRSARCSQSSSIALSQARTLRLGSKKRSVYAKVRGKAGGQARGASAPGLFTHCS